MDLVYISTRRLKVSSEKDHLKPNLEKIDEKGILHFEDKTTFGADIIILCWGSNFFIFIFIFIFFFLFYFIFIIFFFFENSFSYDYSFFDEIEDQDIKKALVVEDNPSRVSLYEYMFVPGVSNLIFIGTPTVSGSL